MKFLDLIQLHNSGNVCRNCVWFKNDPLHVEAAFPGLKIMSSGYASVRDQDGICDYHQIYLSGRDSCAQFRSDAEASSDEVIPEKKTAENSSTVV